jgi:hypothetical protein
MLFRQGLGYAVVSAAASAILLFVPLVLVGYSASVVAAVMSGENLAWQSGVGMSYAIGLPLALVSLLLLILPYRLMRSAGSRMGMRPAVVWVSGLLVMWHAVVAATWAWNSTAGFTDAAVGDEVWIPLAFGVAAVFATAVIEIRGAPAAIAFLGLLALVLFGSIRGQTPIPAGAQELHVVVTGTTVQLDPVSVRAGDVYVVLDSPRSSVDFTPAAGDAAMPVSGSLDLDGCSDAQRSDDRGQQGYCGNVFRVTLPAGNYVFTHPDGYVPGESSYLEVRP